MGLADRDYQRKGDDWLKRLQRRSWWARIGSMPVIATATALLSLGSAAVWFLRDAARLPQLFSPADGSLVVNVNTATLRELQTLPGIGPALAQRIVLGRPYASTGELVRLTGISPRMVKELAPLLTVEGETRRVRKE